MMPSELSGPQINHLWNALTRVRDAEAKVERCREALESAQRQTQDAQRTFEELREKFFKDFPELLPPWTQSLMAQTSEATPVPVPSPQGPLEFREMSNNPYDVPGGES